MKLTPYIHFEGNAEEALNFYAEALGGDVIAMNRYGDSPMPSDEEYKDKVIHGRMLFGDNLIMVSDVFKGKIAGKDGNIQLSIEIAEEAKIDAVLRK